MNLTKPLILDGSTGVYLQGKGMPAGVCPETWILQNPGVLLELQRGYVAAGTEILCCPTFGANREKLSRYAIADKVSQYNRDLVALSREAAGGKAKIYGDISALGLFIEPFGESSFGEIYDIYREQAEAIEAAGADGFIVETMMTVCEARAAVLAIRSVSQKPVFCTFTVGETGKTLTGIDTLAALTVMQGMGVQAFGLNCSTGPDMMLDILKEFAPYAEIPLIAKPNAGLPKIIGDKTVFDLSADDFASFALPLIEAGVSVIGGCCGTAPEHIAALCKKLSDTVLPPRTKEDDMIAASRTQAYFLSSVQEIGRPVYCSDDMSEDILDAEDRDGITKIVLREKSDIAQFEKNQYMIKKPLCLSSDDPGLLEQGLTVFNGRAVYDPTDGLSDETVHRLQQKFGIIII